MTSLTPYQPAPHRSGASGGTITPGKAARIMLALLLYFVSLGWRKIRPIVNNSLVQMLCGFGAITLFMSAQLKQFADAVRQPSYAPKADTMWIGGPKKAVTAPMPYNEAAPVSAKQLTEEMALNYIARYHKTAVTEMHRYGIPASISLAQGLVESRAGDSKLARNNNNHFGIKCFSRRCGKGHCSNFTDDTHKDFFRKFKSPWESWRAHSELLQKPLYKRLYRSKDYRQWAYGLKACGYATDRTYAEKLIGIIERYGLDAYDR